MNFRARIQKLKPPMSLHGLASQFIDRMYRPYRPGECDPFNELLSMLETEVERREGPRAPWLLAGIQDDLFLLLQLQELAVEECVREASSSINLGEFVTALSAGQVLSSPQFVARCVSRFNHLAVICTALDLIQAECVQGPPLPAPLTVYLAFAQVACLAIYGLLSLYKSREPSQLLTPGEITAEAEAKVRELIRRAHATACSGNCWRGRHLFQLLEFVILQRIHDRGLIDRANNNTAVRSDSCKKARAPKGAARAVSGLRRSGETNCVRELLNEINELVGEAAAAYRQSQADSFADPDAYVCDLLKHASMPGYSLDRASVLKRVGVNIGLRDRRAGRVMKSFETIRLRPTPAKAATQCLDWLFRFPGAQPFPLAGLLSQIEEQITDQVRAVELEQYYVEAGQEGLYRVEIVVMAAAAWIEEISTTLDLFAAAGAQTSDQFRASPDLLRRLIQQQRRLAISTHAMGLAADRLAGMRFPAVPLATFLRLRRCPGWEACAEAIDATDHGIVEDATLEARKWLGNLLCLARTSTSVPGFYRTVLRFAHAHADLMRRLGDWELFREASSETR